MSIAVVVWGPPEAALERHERLCMASDFGEAVLFHPAARVAVFGGVRVLECDACGAREIDPAPVGVA